MKNLIKINPQRLQYMMELWQWDEDELLAHINLSSRPVTLKKEDVFNENIKVSHLKRIGAAFGKSPSFFTDPAPIDRSRRASIFFRKKQFNSELAPGDREIVHKTETDSYGLSALCALSDYAIKRILPEFKISDKPQEVAYKIREQLYPTKKSGNDKAFLSELISTFSEKNILVLEFVESPHKNNKTTLDGFFIAPQTIGLKRNQKAMKREIFTLAHELGHYLLLSEELDSSLWSSTAKSPVERWCDAFAFHFLAGKDGVEKIQQLKSADISLKNSEIIAFSNQKHISRLSLFYNLAASQRITWAQFNSLKNQLEEEYELSKIQREKETEAAKAAGKSVRCSAAKAIISPLEKNIYLSAFYEGVIEEYDLLSRFKKTDINGITG